MFEIVFSFNVKDNNIFQCKQNIRLSFNIKTILQGFANENAHDYIKQ